MNHARNNHNERDRFSVDKKMSRENNNFDYRSFSRDPIDRYKNNKSEKNLKEKKEVMNYSRDDDSSNSEDIFQNNSIEPVEIIKNKEKFNQVLLKLFIYIYYYEKALSEKNVFLNGQEEYTFINPDWLKKFKNYYSYSTFIKKIDSIKLNYNYESIDLNIEKIITSIPNEVKPYGNYLPLEFTKINFLIANLIKINSITFISKGIIIPLKIINLIKNLIECQMNIPKKRIIFKDNFIYYINSEKIIIAYFLSSALFIPNYALIYKSVELEKKEENELISLSINQYIKFRNCNIYEKNQILKNEKNEEIGTLIIIFLKDSKVNQIKYHRDSYRNINYNNNYNNNYYNFLNDYSPCRACINTNENKHQPQSQTRENRFNNFIINSTYGKYYYENKPHNKNMQIPNYKPFINKPENETLNQIKNDEKIAKLEKMVFDLNNKIVNMEKNQQNYNKLNIKYKNLEKEHNQLLEKNQKNDKKISPLTVDNFKLIKESVIYEEKSIYNKDSNIINEKLDFDNHTNNNINSLNNQIEQKTIPESNEINIKINMNEFNKLKNELNSLKQKIIYSENEINRLKAIIKEKEQEKKNILKNLNEKEINIKDVNEKYNKILKQNKVLEKNNLSLRKQKEESLNEINKLKEEISKQENKINRFNNVNSDISNLNQILKEKDKQISNNIKEISKLTNDKNLYNIKIIEQKNEINQLKVQIDQNKQREVDLKLKEKSLNKKSSDLDEKENKKNKLIENNKNLTKQNEQLEKNISELKLKKEKLMNDMKLYEEQIPAQKNIINNAKNLNKQIEDLENKLKKKDEQMKINNLNKNKEIEKIKKENDLLNKNYNDKNKEINDLKIKINQLQKNEIQLNLLQDKEKEISNKMKELEEKEKNILILNEKYKALKCVNVNNISILNKQKEKEIIEIKKEEQMNPYFPSNSPIFPDGYSKPTLIGLAKIDFNGYKNSVLQCLSQTVELTKYFLREDNKEKLINNDKNDTKLCPIYCELIQSLWKIDSTNKSFSPDNLLKSVETMKKNEQNNITIGGPYETKDFITFILESIHKELNKPVKSKVIFGQSNPEFQLNSYDKNNALNHFFNEFQNKTSIVSDIFYGINEITHICQNCKNNYNLMDQKEPISYNYEIFDFLTFNLKEVKNYREQLNKTNNSNIITLFDCFEYNQRNEYLSGENARYCNNCKNTSDSINTSKIFVSPNVLILLFKEINEEKSDIKINIETQINISDYVLLKDKSDIYNLYGIIINIGKIGQNEHFVAICKNRVDNNWYKYNDEEVELFNNFQKNICNIGSPYILFYEKLKNN